MAIVGHGHGGRIVMNGETREQLIRNTAQRMVDRFKLSAPRQATLRAVELRYAGDREGTELWKQVSEVAKSLLDNELAPKSTSDSHKPSH